MLDAQLIDPEFYTLRPRDLEEVFPWDHIHTGVSKRYLKNEFLKSKEGSSQATVARVAMVVES